VVAVPDLFHRAGYHLTFRFPEERDEAMKNTQHTNYFTWAQDSRTTLDWLRAHPNVDPERLATYGHCYGGTVAFVSAALNKDVKVALCCYPGGMVNRPMSPGQPVPPIMLIPELNARVFLMSGNGDQNPSPADVEVIRAMMERYGKEFESHLYEGDPPAGHAFFEFGLVMHHEAASDWGWPIKLDYLRRALKDPVAVGV
jgi:dienelactone hydrolase